MNWYMIWPILLALTANTFYNICSKSLPSKLNPFAGLTITYLVAAAFSVIMFFLTTKDLSFMKEIAKANWSSFILGIAVVMLEFGFINIYRSGWKVSAGAAVANISLACVLLVVGIIFYKEHVTVRQLAGLGACITGLWLMM